MKILVGIANFKAQIAVMFGSCSPNTEDAAWCKGHMGSPEWPVYCSMYKKSLMFLELVDSRKLYETV
jgi:hypothetical protein